LDGKVKNISEVVDGVKAAVSAIPEIQDNMKQIKRPLAELVYYSKSIVMALGSSTAKRGPLFDEKISKQLLSVSTGFTAENVDLAAASTMPKFLHTQALLLCLQEEKEVSRYIMEAILFSSKASDKKITKNTKVACKHGDLKSQIAKVLKLNVSTKASNTALQTPHIESASLSVGYTQKDGVRMENSVRVRLVRPFKRSG
jgi:hypothetical protein